MTRGQEHRQSPKTPVPSRPAKGDRVYQAGVGPGVVRRVGSGDPPEWLDVRWDHGSLYPARVWFPTHRLLPYCKEADDAAE